MMTRNQEEIKNIKMINAEQVQFEIDGKTMIRRLYAKNGKMQFRYNNEMIEVEQEQIEVEIEQKKEESKNTIEPIRTDLSTLNIKPIQTLAKALRQRGMSLYQAEIAFYTDNSERLMASLSFRERLGAYVEEMYWEDAKGCEYEFDVSRFMTTDPVDDVLEKIEEMIKALYLEVPTIEERKVA